MELAVLGIVDTVWIGKSVTMSTGFVTMGVRQVITVIDVKESVLQSYTEETVCRTAVKNVTCPKDVTEGPVSVIMVVKRDGNLLCVWKNVMTEHLEQIAAVHVATVLKDSDVTRKLGLVPMDVTPFTRGSTAPKHVLKLTMDRIAT